MPVAVSLARFEPKTLFYCKTLISAKTDSFGLKMPARVGLADHFLRVLDMDYGKSVIKSATGCTL